MIISDDVERQFKRVVMKRYGDGKRALSEAALGDWSSREDTDVAISLGLEDDPLWGIESLALFTSLS